MYALDLVHAKSIQLVCFSLLPLTQEPSYLEELTGLAALHQAVMQQHDAREESLQQRAKEGGEEAGGSSDGGDEEDWMEL